MTDAIRFRTRGSNVAFSQVLGTTFYKNKRNGRELAGTPVSAVFSPGVIEKCFDINHGVRESYHIGGNLFLIRLTEPTGIGGSGRIEAYQALQNAPDSYKEKSQPGDLWQVGYEGNFIHTNLPDLTTIPNKNISGPDDYRAEVNPSDLSSLGARGWSKLRPKVGIGTLGQAIAEARDVPKTLKTTFGAFHEVWKAVGGSQHVPIWNNRAGSSAKFLKQIKQYPKRASNHFLNTVFGWSPTINDLNNLYKLIADYETYLDKAERSNDRWLNRRFAEEVVESSSVVLNQTRSKSSPLFTTYLNPAFGTAICQSVSLLVERQRMTRVWYEGSFRSYNYAFDKRSPMPKALKDAQGFLSLAGADINPTLIYKVTPWTWLVDWFVNVGDNIQVAQDIISNSVACQYMYLMRESYDRYRYTTTHVFPNATITCISYQEVRCKRRTGTENPFGFSLLPGSLSGMQLGILAALGLSKFS